MELPDIFAAVLGLSRPWKVDGIAFDEEEKRLDINVTCATPVTVCCPHCGATARSSHTIDEVWYHDNFFSHATYLYTQVPHVDCCQPISLERPWSRTGSRFSQLS